MSKAPEFYYLDKTTKPVNQRVHRNSACPPSRDIPELARPSGTNRYSTVSATLGRSH
jgi:hypothetical protein